MCRSFFWKHPVLVWVLFCAKSYTKIASGVAECVVAEVTGRLQTDETYRKLKDNDYILPIQRE